MSEEPIRVRRAHAIIVTLHGDRFQVTNYLQRKTFSCNSECLNLLARLNELTALSQVGAIFDAYTSESIATQLVQLVGMGALLLEGSADELEDQHYLETWEWGSTAGLYHFAIRDAQYLDDEQTERHIKERARLRPAPVNYSTNDGTKDLYDLGRVKTSDPVFSAMMKRRTIRGFKNIPISKRELGECLFSGLGIVAFYEDPILGRMPVKLTPSGGARNPYEAYVYALNVNGMPAGIYHYSALENSLQLVNDTKLPAPGQLLSGQDWTDSAAAIVFLVANFDRTMWKYQNPTAYRVVIIEAGHIAQNIAITAAKLGLSANPTSAIQDSLSERALRLKPPMQAVIYALSVGHPDPRKGPKKTR